MSKSTTKPELVSADNESGSLASKAKLLGKILVCVELKYKWTKIILTFSININLIENVRL